MKVKTLPSFWKYYARLDEKVKKQAKKAFTIWKENPFHPSLHFKCVQPEENIWSIRITRSYRALCMYEKDTVVWFWIGNHYDYQTLLKHAR